MEKVLFRKEPFLRTIPTQINTIWPSVLVNIKAENMSTTFIIMPRSMQTGR